jgi:hypothetical protein
MITAYCFIERNDECIWLYVSIYVYIYDMIYLLTAVVFSPGGSGQQTGIQIGNEQLYT